MRDSVLARMTDEQYFELLNNSSSIRNDDNHRGSDSTVFAIYCRIQIKIAK